MKRLMGCFRRIRCAACLLGDELCGGHDCRDLGAYRCKLGWPGIVDAPLEAGETIALSLGDAEGGCVTAGRGGPAEFVDV